MRITQIPATGSTIDHRPLIRRAVEEAAFLLCGAPSFSPEPEHILVP
ncbi:hypothetical protein Daudx_0637 [Candidatus Desulforudis audaxviator]|nr:hypothetical protein Daudx_0637 [Candidatus Desulforudis audaxviator]